MIKATLFAIFILFSYATLESNAASCPNIPVISNFDASRYIGTWYEIQRFNYIFELGLKCVSATYGSINSTMISVYNKGTTIFNTVSTVSGYAYAPDSSAPNKLVVNLPVQIGSLTLFRNNGDYQVVDTDYTNYALVYSCKLTLGFIKSEVVWILSRQKTLSDATITNLKSKLTNLGISTKSFVSVDQSC